MQAVPAALARFRRPLAVVVAGVGTILLAGFNSARPSDGRRVRAGTSDDSAAVVSTVSGFQQALARGDSATALELLASDATILESGDIETRADYRAHHLAADIEFAKGVPGRRQVRAVVVHGDAAWVSTTSTAQGTFRGRAMSTAGAELMVLARAASGAPWRIRAIHWSSRRRGS